MWVPTHDVKTVEGVSVNVYVCVAWPQFLIHHSTLHTSPDNNTSQTTVKVKENMVELTLITSIGLEAAVPINPARKLALQRERERRE